MADRTGVRFLRRCDNRGNYRGSFQRIPPEFCQGSVLIAAGDSFLTPVPNFEAKGNKAELGGSTFSGLVAESYSRKRLCGVVGEFLPLKARRQEP